MNEVEIATRLSVIRDNLKILRDSAEKDINREMACGFMNAGFVGYYSGKRHAYDTALAMIDSIVDELDV